MAIDAEVCVDGLIIRRCRLRWVIHDASSMNGGVGVSVSRDSEIEAATNLRFQARLINESLKKVRNAAGVISNDTQWPRRSARGLSA